MARTRATRQPALPTFETLEARDMPSADLAAALPASPPCPAATVLAAPDRGSDTLGPGAQTLIARTQARLHVVAPPDYDLDKAARLIAEKFNADFNQKGNIWGIESVRLTYYGRFDHDGTPWVDVRVELQVRDPEWPDGRSTVIDFHMNFETTRGAMDPKQVYFKLTRTEVWWRGRQTAAFLPLETAVHLAWFFSVPNFPVGGAAGASSGTRALPMASRGDGPAGTAPPARFANLHGQPETVLPPAAAGAVPTVPLAGTPARADLDALLASYC
jgi:hypothetical protein